MTFSKTKGINFILATIIFFVVLTSIVLVESISHAYLPADQEIHPLGNSHLFIVAATTAVIATFLIISLFFRTLVLSAELREKDLLTTKEHWEETFNSMTDFVSVHDGQYRIVKVNHALCEFLHKKPEEIIGKYCYQVFHDLDKPYPNCPQRKTTEINHPVTEIISDPNIGVPLQITCSPIFDERNEFLGSLHVARISEEINKRRDKPVKLFPICASCKNIRNHNDEWVTPEEYFIQTYDFQFSHTICQSCSEQLYPELNKA